MPLTPALSPKRGEGVPRKRERQKRSRMREIVLDTETTGLDPLQGDRVVEIGCIELYNGIPTGRTFHRYVNPERDMPASAFDAAFINSELDRIGKPLVLRERLVDTLMLARRKHPAGPNRLDDLCVRYGIDNARRTKHGALLDAEILAEVYLELIGARQAQ